MRIQLFVVALTFSSVLGWSADWLTTGADPQRTGWQKNEKILNTANVKGLSLLWSLKTDNQPRQMHNLFPPLVVEKVKTTTGTKEVALLAGISDNIYAIDVARGTIIWQKHFSPAYTEATVKPRGGVLCPGGLTADPVIAPAATPGKYTIYVASWDGSLHQINLADGEDIAPPAKWMPPNGKPYGLNLVNGVLYTMTAQSCGGNPNYVYSYDLATKKASMWSDGSGGMWGYRGMAVGADGTAYTGTGDGMWDPANGLYGNGIIGVKFNPTTKQLDLRNILPGNADFLQARCRCPDYANHLQFQRQRISGRHFQGMPLLAARYSQLRRRRSPLLQLREPAHLQRVQHVRHRRVGRAFQLDGCERDAMGPVAFLGTARIVVRHQRHHHLRAHYARCDVRFQSGRKERQGGPDARLDLTRHAIRGPAGDRQRHCVRLRQVWGDRHQLDS